MEKGSQLFVEQWQIQGMQMLKVVVALLVEWCLFTIQEVVIERDAYWFDAVDGQLHAETFTGSGLSRRRRTCNQHHLDALTLSYLIGNLCNLLFLQSLTNLDEDR